MKLNIDGTNAIMLSIIVNLQSYSNDYMKAVVYASTLKMFLNDIGQPSILSEEQRYGSFESHSGPLILTAAAFKKHTISRNWCRRVIGSAEDMTLYRHTTGDKLQPCVYNVIAPNKPLIIAYKTMLTLIPMGHNNHLFYLKNDYIRALIVDKLSGHLDFIPKADQSFHAALRSGIDVIYIDDACYMSEDPEAEEQKLHIYSLVQLIRPRYLIGLRHDRIPSSLRQLCRRQDYAPQLNSKYVNTHSEIS